MQERYFIENEKVRNKKTTANLITVAFDTLICSHLLNDQLLGLGKTIIGYFDYINTFIFH